MIQCLSARCEELSIRVSDMSNTSNLLYLLKLLMETAKKNSGREKHGRTYDSDIKYFCVYLFIIGGRFLYQTLYENLQPSVPSLSEVERTLASASAPVKEGKFRFTELCQFLSVNKLPMKVYLSEDGTRVLQKFLYDLTSDQIIGPVPPLAENGVPVMNCFPASSAAMIARHFEKGVPASSAYAIMAQPLQDGAPSFCLSMFGTDNKFTTEQVYKRWNFIYEELAKIGIECVGFSADGDPKVLAAMHYAVFKAGPPCPAEFKDFYFASGEQKFSVMQDYVHTVNKFRARLSPAHYLPLGKYNASASHLTVLMDTVPKEEHGLTPSDLQKDKMNFNASFKICSERVTSLLKAHVPGSEGTVAYLNAMRSVLEAGLNEALSPSEKINKIWFAVFFLRFWKSWLIASQQFTLDNFVTRNLYMCVEIIGHTLIHCIIKCREEDCPESLLIHLFSSQTCESIFRLLRSMTTTESTVINFSIKEILQKVRRIDMLHHVTSKLAGKLEFPREKRKRLLGALTEEKLKSTYLPLNEEIRMCVLQAKNEAIEVLQKLGVPCPQDQQFVAKMKTSLLSSKHFDLEETVDDAPTVYEAEPDDEDIPLNLLAAFPTPESATDLDIHGAVSESNMLPCKTSHVLVPDKKGGFKTISKSLLCWMFSSCGSPTLNNIRIHRVRETVLTSLGCAQRNRAPTVVSGRDEVEIGNWCIFRERSTFFVLQILGFKYLSGSNLTFSLSKAPVQPPPGTRARGIGCHGVKYSIGKDFLEHDCMQHRCINIKQYVATIPSPIPNVSGKLQLTSEALTYILHLQSS